MIRRKLSVKAVEPVVFTMLADLRDFERRQTGAIIEDAVRSYWEEVFGDDQDDPERNV